MMVQACGPAPNNGIVPRGLLINMGGGASEEEFRQCYQERAEAQVAPVSSAGAPSEGGRTGSWGPIDSI